MQGHVAMHKVHTCPTNLRKCVRDSFRWGETVNWFKFKEKIWESARFSEAEGNMIIYFRRYYFTGKQFWS